MSHFYNVVQRIEDDAQGTDATMSQYYSDTTGIDDSNKASEYRQVTYDTTFPDATTKDDPICNEMEQRIDKFLRFMDAYVTIRRGRYILDQTVEAASLRVCGNCGNKAVILESEQLRSADEESTGVVKCLECGS